MSTKQQAYCITILILSIVHLLLSLLVAFSYCKKDSVVVAFAIISSAVNLVILILAAITLHMFRKEKYFNLLSGTPCSSSFPGCSCTCPAHSNDCKCK